MNQRQRDKKAIITILEQVGEATYPEIALRGGEGLHGALLDLIYEDKVIRFFDETKSFQFQTTYRLEKRCV